MPFATLDGVKTHYVRLGSGPPLLMMAPRAFDSTLQSWKHGKWDGMNAVEALSRHFIPASIWPGDDASHSTSSAQQLRELLPRMEYWDLHPDKQTAQNMLSRLIEFTNNVETRGLPPSPHPWTPDATASFKLSGEA